MPTNDIERLARSQRLLVEDVDDALIAVQDLVDYAVDVPLDQQLIPKDSGPERTKQVDRLRVLDAVVVGLRVSQQVSFH